MLDQRRRRWSSIKRALGVRVYQHLLLLATYPRVTSLRRISSNDTTSAHNLNRSILALLLINTQGVMREAVTCK